MLRDHPTSDGHPESGLADEGSLPSEVAGQHGERGQRLATFGAKASGGQGWVYQESLSVYSVSQQC